MPTQQLERWSKDGANVTAQLDALGHAVVIEYADEDPQLQADQIRQMIQGGVDALVVGAVDASSLTGILAEAGAADIPVIAYDRLILDTPDIDFYATFDNERVGIQQATSLLQGIGVLAETGRDTGVEGPFYIEIFAGSPDDNNATVFYAGAMGVLQPYLDSGVLQVVSGETDFATVATPAWDGETAAARMSSLLKGYDADQQLHGVLAPNDGIAQALITCSPAPGSIRAAGTFPSCPARTPTSPRRSPSPRASSTRRSARPPRRGRDRRVPPTAAPHLPGVERRHGGPAHRLRLAVPRVHDPAVG